MASRETWEQIRAVLYEASVVAEDEDIGHALWCLERGAAALLVGMAREPKFEFGPGGRLREVPNCEEHDGVHRLDFKQPDDGSPPYLHCDICGHTEPAKP